VVLVWNSTLRLKHETDNPDLRRGLNTAEARRWREALAEKSKQERAGVGKCSPPALREYLRERLDAIDADLRHLGRRLTP
jgi:hypothetical protein